MTYEEAKAQLMKDFGWTADYAEHALAFFMANADYTDPDVFYGAFHQPIWRDDLAAWNPRPSTTGGITLVAVDPAIQQVLQQNAYIADALYDMAKLIAIAEINGALGPGSHAALLQDAKTKINALNPAKFTFP